MSEERKPKQILESGAEGKRGRRRPRIECEDYMGQMKGRRGEILQNIKRIVKDRDNFKTRLFKGHKRIGKGKE